MSGSFSFYNYNPVYDINGICFELDIENNNVKDVFELNQQDVKEIYAENNRKYFKWLVELKVSLNHHKKKAYCLFSDMLQAFKYETELTYRDFDYHSAMELAFAIHNNNADLPYYIRQVMKYMSYDTFGGLLRGDASIEVPSDADVKEYYCRKDSEGYNVYKYLKAEVYIQDGKIEEGVDMCHSAQNFVIWATVQCASEFTQACTVYYRKNRMEIRLGNSKILYRFSEPSAVYANILGLPEEKRHAKFKPNVNCSDCIDFVDSVFAHTRYMTEKITGGNNLNAFN